MYVRKVKPPKPPPGCIAIRMLDSGEIRHLLPEEALDLVRRDLARLVITDPYVAARRARREQLAQDPVSDLDSEPEPEDTRDFWRRY